MTEKDGRHFIEINDTFGLLKVIGLDGKDAICECKCGTIKRIRKGSLTKKKDPTKSCGCLRRLAIIDAGRLTIEQNSKQQIEINKKHNTNFQVITSQKPPHNNKSGMKGVKFRPDRGKWEVYLNIHGKRIHLGCYDTYDKAAEVRQEAEKEYYKPLIDRLEK